MALAWLAILAFIYYLVLVFARWGTDDAQTHPLAAVIVAGGLGPGLLIGHGALPVPGGIAFLLSLLMPPYGLNQVINAVCWIVAAVVLMEVDRSALKREK